MRRAEGKKKKKARGAAGKDVLGLLKPAQCG